MKKNRAFTLIETLIAITLITVVITAASGLILNTLLSNQRNIHNLQAMYLAQESLEALRFMRDSNWLQNYSWDGGEALWGTNIADANGLYLDEVPCNPPNNVCFRFSSSADDGQVSMEDGFVFTRSIEITPVKDEEETLEITAAVEWEERGKDRSLELSTYLSNWQ